MNKKILLNNDWKISSKRYQNVQANAPCSVLSALLDNGLIDDPFYRDNEEKVRDVLEEDFAFEKQFNLTKEQLNDTNFLCLDGIDTIAKVYINNTFVCECKDMHLATKIKLEKSLLKQANTIRIEFTSPYTYINEYPNKENFESYAQPFQQKYGPVIRKAHSMLGWDWGPNLGDMGIFRDVYIISTKLGYLDNYRLETEIVSKDLANLHLTLNSLVLNNSKCKVIVSFREKQLFEQEKPLEESTTFDIQIHNPKLWYPVGLGEQPLYDLKVILSNDNEQQEYSYKVGIRTIKIDDSKDEFGRNFAVYINGIKVFLKGANYIPEDSILAKTNKERTRKLLSLARDFNHNCVRVWGGGYYPDDYFYEICDELGLLVFQDLMFACAIYDIQIPEFRNLVELETKYNLRRIRNHPSLLMISGNNEIEDAVRGHGHIKAVNYVEMFEKILRTIVKEETNLYYLPSSPTSGEPLFAMPNDPNYLDTHYWLVWGNGQPFEDYLTIKPRLLSEFGCQAFSTMNTIKSFAEKEDLSFNSKVMQAHQKRPGANERILDYINSYFGASKKFEENVYLSMLTQATAMKIAVEHLRGNKDRCNGAIYWQLNDCWPGQTWSSIDYKFNLKALHYFSKRFYNESLVSFKKEEDIILNISNDSKFDKKYSIKVSKYNLSGKIMDSLSLCDINIPRCSDKDIFRLKANFVSDEEFLKAELFEDDKLVSENYYQNKKDVDIKLEKANVKLTQFDNHTIKVTTDVFTKFVYLETKEDEVILSDNFFNLIPGQEKIIISSSKINIKDIKIMTLNQIKAS